MIPILSISYEIALKLMEENPVDCLSTLVQVMVWCRQAVTSYLRDHMVPLGHNDYPRGFDLWFLIYYCSVH